MATINTAINLSDGITATLMNITNALNLTVGAFQDVQNTAAHDIDVSAFEAVRNEINAATMGIHAMESAASKVQPPKVPVQPVWNIKSNMDIFDGVSTDRLTSKMTAANAAYTALNSVVNSTDTYIRDNADEQRRFNSSLNQSSGHANLLTNEIMSMASAYLSLEGVSKVLDLSDTMSQMDARLSLMVDDGGSVQELQDKIYLSAQNSRGAYLDTASAVAKLGLTAGSSFSGTDEIIAFTEQMNKNFVIGGASVQEQTSAMHQLTQAMASGKLQGDEYRSIMENAPLLGQAIEQYMTNAGVEGTMKDWSADGLLTTDVIKAALFSVTDETNARFESMPKTFAQVGQSIQNQALMAFEPILDRLNGVANSETFNGLVTNLIDVFVILSGVVSEIFNLIAQSAQFILSNWSLIVPLIIGVAAAFAIYNGILLVHNGVLAITAMWKGLMALREAAHAAATMLSTGKTFAQTTAQHGLNAALLACPITWIILAIIALIALVYLVVAAINKFAGTSTSATGIIFGAFTWLGSVIANIFMGLLDLVFAIINELVNPFIRFANFLANLFTNPISSIIYTFQGMADTVLSILEAIASALDFVFGSHMADAVAGWRSGLKEMADAAVAKHAPNENYQKVIEELDLSVENTLGWKRFDNTDAFDVGYKAGENLDSAIANFDPASLFKSNNPNDYANTIDTSSLANNVGNIANNTDSMKKGMEINGEELKYLHDLAERDVVNRFTTAEVRVNFGGVNNHVSSNVDLDGMVAYIGEKVKEELDAVAEGVHT